MISGFAFQSCINDDLENCFNEKRVYFDYLPITYANNKGEIDPEDVTRMNLFVFDEEGKFLQEYVDENPALSPDYYMTVTGLKSGRYKFVAWGSLENQYGLHASGKAMIPGQTTIDELEVFLKNITDHTVTDWLNPLFYATHTKNSAIEILAMQSQNIHLDLIDDTYRINVKITGVDSTSVMQNGYGITITDNNGKYKFDNDFAPCEEFNYIKSCSVSKEKNYEMNASLMVLRLTNTHTNPILRVMNAKTNTPLIQSNLIALILAANDSGANIDFYKTHVFDIKFELNPAAPLECIIYINGFRLVLQVAEL
jgi:hypothetical protein